MKVSRRDFTKVTAACVCSSSAVVADEAKTHRHADLQGLIGVTTGSFSRHLSDTDKPGKLVLLDLPKIMRNELDLRVLDLMTATLPSMETAYLEKLRDRAVEAGCIITNLKMNQKGIDIGSSDPEKRKHAIKIYEQSVDAADTLGCRWVRPLPQADHPNMEAYVQSYCELIDYAGPRKITLLIENFGWLQDDPDAIPQVIEAVGKGLDASVDTGNWTDRARYEGLAKAFPLAVTCDFKAFQLGEDDAHPRYDLRRCFQIGWDAGYRGPWCFEHVHASLDELLNEMIRLRDMIRTWTKENTG